MVTFVLIEGTGLKGAESLMSNIHIQIKNLHPKVNFIRIDPDVVSSSKIAAVIVNASQNGPVYLISHSYGTIKADKALRIMEKYLKNTGPFVEKAFLVAGRSTDGRLFGRKSVPKSVKELYYFQVFPLDILGNWILAFWKNRYKGPAHNYRIWLFPLFGHYQILSKVFTKYIKLEIQDV